MTSKARKREGTRPKRLMPKKLPSQDRSRELVDAIVEAARRVLATRGWKRFSMQAVAQTAGVSPGSLYQYFPNKDALVAELIERESRHELEHYLQVFATIPFDASITTILDAFVRAMLDYQSNRTELMTQALAAIPDLGRLPALRQNAQQVVSFLQSQLETRATLPPDLNPKWAAHVLANAIHSLTHDGILPRPDALDDETLAREISRLIHGYLGTC